MSKLLGVLGVAVMAVSMAACASTGKPAGSGCEACTYGYASVMKNSERHAFCVVNGKQVDCTKNPSDCPSCAKK